MSECDEPLCPTDQEPASQAVRVRRQAHRADYDPAAVNAVLDAALYCQVGAVRDGAPVVIPMMHARDRDRLLLHGSAAAGVFRDARRASPVCVTVTMFDGLVLARSVRKHSMNYRSAVVHGVPTEITDPDAKRAALRRLVEHAVPGRWGHARAPTDAELRETGIWSLGLEQASAKVRAGGPLDDPDDLDLPMWAGHLPAVTALMAPIAADDLEPGTKLPEHVARLVDGSGGVRSSEGPIHERVSSGSPFEPTIGFSRAVRVGDRVLVSGTGPVWPDGSCDPDAGAQARRCLEIIAWALAEVHTSVEDVVRTRMFLTDPAVADAVSAAHGQVFGEVRPAATMVIVAGLLDPRWLVEIEAEAVAPPVAGGRGA